MSTTEVVDRPVQVTGSPVQVTGSPVQVTGSPVQVTGQEVLLGSKRKHLIDGIIDFTGGTAGGVASVYVGQPLDTVKVKLQTFPTLYRNAWHCFVNTFRTEGVRRGLYAGTVPSLAAQVSENSILFLAYGMCQKTVATLCQKTDIKDLSVVQNALAGSCAAFFSSLTLCPTELIKCKLQAMQEMKSCGQLTGPLAKYAGDNLGPWSLTRQILQEEGVAGLFRGLVPTLAREMPGYFFFFGGYEICRALLTPPGKSKDDLSPMRTIFCGGMGGVSLWIAIFPTDVIKSRIQVQSTGKELGVITMLLKISREEGVLALYKGLGPTLARTFPATGALFFVYENTKSLVARQFYGDETFED